MSNEDNTFKSTQDGVSKCLVDTTRTASQIAQEDLTFQRASNPNVMRQLDQQNARILSLAQRLTHGAASGTTAKKPKIKSLEALDDNWKAIVDVVDSLLEKADACLDEFTGFITKKPQPDDIDGKDIPRSHALKDSNLSKIRRDADLPKPQLLFNKTTNNHDAGPFKPLLRTKPHAIVPLEQSLAINKDTSQYQHPYKAEIAQHKYPPSIYTRAEPVPYHPLDSSSATFVDTPEAVLQMLAELKTASVIAVDLEHHDKHSYVGLVSLMQISTRDKDWVVDTLKPWREDLQVLNEVFADPAIIKVFHGAFMDMVWLQRDLGLYVVGLFDTYHAASALNYPGKGLAYLLKRFAGFHAQKKYQMADWRIRPLPTDMFSYARCDTHFLLYVFDNMRNELIDSSNPSLPDGDLIQQVLEGSKRETLQVYEISSYDADLGTGTGGWYNIVSRTPAMFTREQFAVFRAVHHWRDKIAREEDEAVTIVMSRAALISVAQHMPTDLPALLSCCRADSDLFKRHTEELLQTVKNARSSSHDGPEMAEILESHPETIRRAAAAAAWKEKQEGALAFVPTAPAELAMKETFSDSIRSTLSRFWGGNLGHPNREHSTQADPSSMDDEVRLSIPLPKLNADIFETAETNGHSHVAGAEANPGALVEHEYVKDRKLKDSSIFIIKDLTGSQKRKASEAEVEGGFSDLPNGTSEASQRAIEETQVMDKARIKAERKAAKAQQKLDIAQQTRDGFQPNVDQQPFDYVNAPTVLHFKNEASITHKSGAIDPYTKSLNAPHGQRRTRTEVAGKSFTFKN